MAITVPNQKRVKINRHRIDYNSERYLAFQADFFQWMCNNFTWGAFKLYGFLCAQVPDSYDGVKNPKNNRAGGLALSPAALKDYCNMDRKTFYAAEELLIKLGFLIDCGSNMFLFDDMPMQYRPKTAQEADEIADMSIEQMCQKAKQSQIEQIVQANPEYWSGQERKKYDWE